MKFALILGSFLFFQTFAQGECFQLNRNKDSDPAEACIETSAASGGLAMSAELYSLSHRLIETITLSGNSWNGAAARFVTRTGRGAKYSVSVDQFSGRDTWAITGVNVGSLKGDSGESSVDSDGSSSAGAGSGGGGSRCIPGHPSHC